MPKRNDQDGVYKRKDSPFWWASFTDAGGQRTRCSTGTTNHREAEALLGKWKLETHRVLRWGEQPEHSYDELMLLYLEQVTPTKRDPERDRAGACRLTEHFSGRMLHDLSARDITSYIQQRRALRRKDATISRELALLSAVLNWARRDLEWDIPNPVQGRKPRPSPGRVRWLTRREADVLVAASVRVKNAAHLPDFIRLALHTGMRKNEMLKLEWRRVDLSAGLVYLGSENQKNGKVGSVPLNREARAAIASRANFRARHCPHSPWVFAHRDGSRIQSVKNGFATARRVAGIENFRIHDLRHTCAAWLVQAGVPILEVCALLRHSDVKVTMRYAHLAPDNVRAAVSVLDAPASRFGHVEGDLETQEAA